MDPSHSTAAQRTMRVPELVDMVLAFYKPTWESDTGAEYRERYQTLCATSLVSRLWYAATKPILYDSIFHGILSPARAQLLTLTLVRYPHLADLVHNLCLYGSENSTILLYTLFNLRRLSLNLLNLAIPDARHLLSAMASAFNSGPHLHSLAVDLHRLYETEEFGEDIRGFLRKLGCLTDLAVCNVDYAADVMFVVQALPKPEKIRRLEMRVVDWHELPVRDSVEVWQGISSSLPALVDLTISGHMCHLLLAHLPRSIWRISFEGCDECFFCHLLICLADKTWLPNLIALPTMKSLALTSSAEAWLQHDMHIPEVKESLDVIVAARIGIWERGLTMTPEFTQCMASLMKSVVDLNDSGIGTPANEEDSASE